jgi:hypothetical protein
MFERLRMSAVSSYSEYIPLAKTNPGLFMSLLPDPDKCPEGVPSDIWSAMLLAVEDASAVSYTSQDRQLAYLAEIAAKFVRPLQS